MPPKPDHEVDARGLKCPEPLMLVRQQVRSMRRGEILKVVADDPSTQRDIPQYCRFVEHDLLHLEQEGSLFLFWLRKGAKAR